MILLGTHKITGPQNNRPAQERTQKNPSMTLLYLTHSFFGSRSPAQSVPTEVVISGTKPTFKGWQLSGLPAHPTHKLQTLANSLGSPNHYYHGWKPYCRTRMGSCGDRERGSNITEPVYGAPLSFPRSTQRAKSALQSGPRVCSPGHSIC